MMWDNSRAAYIWLLRPGVKPPRLDAAWAERSNDNVTTMLRINAGPYTFGARLEETISPQTCAAFLTVLPFKSSLIQARWSGESLWIPLGDYSIGVGPEDPIHEPQPGEILFYPAGVSETEILFPYGETRFASKFGPLAGNHFLTIVEGAEQLPALGQLVLQQGAQEVVFALA